MTNQFEVQNDAGYWVDTSDEAIAWRTEVFRKRRIETDRISRFDLEATAALWESWSSAGVKWAKALREFGALGGRCEYWCGLPNSASAIPLTFALYAPDGKQMPCNYRLKDIKAAIVALQDSQK